MLVLGKWKDGRREVIRPKSVYTPREGHKLAVLGCGAFEFLSCAGPSPIRRVGPLSTNPNFVWLSDGQCRS